MVLHRRGKDYSARIIAEVDGTEKRSLRECRRVLTPGGALVFTVPVIVGRMSRSREGLPNSYHGNPTTGDDALVVHTEYGADVWTGIMRAGFKRCVLVSHRYPAGLAWIARK